MSDDALLARLEAEEAKVRLVLAHVLDQDPDAAIAWTGRTMPVGKFLPHLLNEFAIHRWDVTGDDDVSQTLLTQPELTEHPGGGTR